MRAQVAASDMAGLVRQDAISWLGVSVRMIRPV